IEKAMLLGEIGNPRLRVLQDMPVAVQAATRIGCQCFRARVENAALPTGAAYYRRKDMERAIVLGRLAAIDHHAVIEDVRAGAVLGGADELADIGQVRRAAGRDDAWLETE